MFRRLSIEKRFRKFLIKTEPLQKVGERGVVYNSKQTS
jgi:hypothetical protein